MQSAAWYFRRLRSMSPGETFWRIGGLAQARMDRALLARRQRPLQLEQFLTNGRRETSIYGDDRVVLPTGRSNSSAGQTANPALLRQAEEILAGRIQLFGDSPVEIGEQIDWNYEYQARMKAPTIFSAAIDYRDYAVTGDCKWVWELNRHHHLVVLARAYQATGEARFAMAVAEQFDSWLMQCPFGIGMNWRSSLELGIRLINWVWAIELIRPADVISTSLGSRILESVHRHIWEIDRKYARYSSANNHVIGEAAGAYIASSYFHQLRNATRWRERAKRILNTEIMNQTHPDGGNKEQATGYQLFVMQFFTLAAVAGERIGDGMAAEYLSRLEKMYEFIAALCEAGPLPQLGDCDDGYVLDLGGRRGDPRPWLAVGAAMFQSPHLADTARGEHEVLANLLGDAGVERISKIPKSETRPLESQLFPDTGLCLLQSGSGDAPLISLTLDAAELGFSSIAAHGHADALSVTLRVNGGDFLMDSGTYDYFTHPKWRHHLRRTIAHNTIEIDGQDQSEILGSFLWGRRANAKLIGWTTEAGRTIATAEHDGYRRLAGPVTHRRTLKLESATGVEIIDDLIGQGSHAIRQAFHFAPECEVTRTGPHSFEIQRAEGRIVFCLDERTQVSIHHGDPSTLLGHVSRRYHQKSESTTLIASCHASLDVRLFTRIWLSVRDSEVRMTSRNQDAYNRQHLHKGHQDDGIRAHSTGSHAT
ncbi:MAG: alginate lyase family protein [Planctomycetes bacterium]|nr:alginate lyase family protein [Planctomycetota bacterium]